MTKSIIKFAKSRDVKLPSRSNKTDAGIDFYVPVFNKQFLEDIKQKNPELFKTKMYYGSGGAGTMAGTGCVVVTGIGGSYSSAVVPKKDNFIFFDETVFKNYFILKPQEKVNIPSGIHYKMGSDRALIAFNKSGVASKDGLVMGASVCDESYQGEVHMNVINTSNNDVKIYENQKLVQFIELPIILSEIKEEAIGGFFEEITSRGAKGFGAHDSI